MPRSFVSENIDVSESLPHPSCNASFATPMCFIALPGTFSCHPYGFANQASQFTSRNVMYHSGMCQASMPQQQPSLPAIELGRAKPVDSGDSKRIKAMESTIKHLNSLLKNEMEAKKIDNQKMTDLENELKQMREEKLANTDNPMTSDLEIKLKQLKEEKQELENQLNQLALHNEERPSRNEDLVRELEEIKEERLELEKSLASVRENICSLTKELDDLKEERVELRKGLTSLHENCSSLIKKLDQANQNKCVLEEKLAEAYQKLAESSGMEAELELAATKDKLDKALEEMATLKKESEGHKKCMTDLHLATLELIKKDQVIEDCKNEMERLRQVIENSKKSITILLTSNNELRSQEEKAKLEKEETLKSALEASTTVEQLRESNVKELVDLDNHWRGKYEKLETDLKDVEVEKGQLEKWFKDLAKEYVYVLQYNGEKMYDGYTSEHEKFLRELRHMKDTGRELFGLQDMIDCIQQQLSECVECRKTFGETVARALRRIDSGMATVSDIQFCTPTPQLEVPVERFESVLVYFKAFFQRTV